MVKAIAARVFRKLADFLEVSADGYRALAELLEPPLEPTADRAPAVTTAAAAPDAPELPELAWLSAAGDQKGETLLEAEDPMVGGRWMIARHDNTDSFNWFSKSHDDEICDMGYADDVDGCKRQIERRRRQALGLEQPAAPPSAAIPATASAAVATP